LRHRNQSSSPTAYHILGRSEANPGIHSVARGGGLDLRRPGEKAGGDIVLCGEASTSQEVLRGPFTPVEKGEISCRLGSLERNIIKFGKMHRPSIAAYELGKSRLIQS
jgi:hypothetical protein